MTDKQTWIDARPKGRRMPIEQVLEMAAKHGVKFAPCSKKKIPICYTKEGGKRTPLPGTTDPAQLREWHEKYPWLSIPKPADHGLVVVDVDIKNAPESTEGLAELDGMLERLAEAVEGAAARSQSGGQHFYYAAPAGLKNKPNLFRNMPTGDELRSTPWCETRSNSPAIAYELEELPGEGGFAELPTWLALAISPPPKKKKHEDISPPAGGGAWGKPEDALREIEDAEEGTRNSTLYRVGIQFLRDAGLAEKAQEALKAAGVRAGLGEEEAAGVVASAMVRAGEPTYYELQQAKLISIREAVKGMWEKYPEGHPNEGDWIPLRDVDVFMRAFPDCRYFENPATEDLEKRGVFLEIAEGRWTIVKKSQVERRLRQVDKVLNGTLDEAKEINKRIKGALRLVMAETLAGSVDEIDTAVAILDATGLPLCLEKGRVGPMDPDWKAPMMKRLGVEYDPKADDDLYARVAAQCRAEGWNEKYHQELVECDERLDGFELLPRKPEKWIVFEVGGGDNGKSMLAETKVEYMGDFGHVMNPAPLLEGYKQEVLTGLNSMAGKRCTIIEEVPAGEYLETPTLKMLSGGTKAEIRNRFEDNKNIRFGSLLRFLSNTRLEFKDTSKGWRNRLLLWTYKNEFTDARGNVDKGLALKLREKKVGSGWLNRALKGLNDFYAKGGVKPPACLTTSTAEYARERGSQVQAFVDACLTRDSSAKNIDIKDIKSVCARWLNQLGIIEDVRDVKEVKRVIGSAKRFGDTLQDITGSVVVGGGRRRVLQGYRLDAGFNDEQPAAEIKKTFSQFSDDDLEAMAEEME